MTKTILITGSTDGIGLATAKTLVESGYKVLLHGRSESKLEDAKTQILDIKSDAIIETFKADLSSFDEIKALATDIKSKHSHLDALINNAGVFVVPKKITDDGLDIRFMVNTIAPYLLTKHLLPLLSDNGRVVNLSSAAQSPVNPDEIGNSSNLSDDQVYAKSKLALTMWSRELALLLQGSSPIIIAVNPASFLGSKMVSEAYGRQGQDLEIGADILVRAALSDEFSEASGLYFDNDIGQFASPHPDALNQEKTAAITKAIEIVLDRFNS